MRTHLSAGQLLQALTWQRPDPRLVGDSHRSHFGARCDALAAVIQGQSIRRAAKSHRVNRHTLTSVVHKAFELASDGSCHGYRACLPWGVRLSKVTLAEVPVEGRPHVLQTLLQAHPEIQAMLATYTHALPPGRLPPSFHRLMHRIRSVLADLGYQRRWPLNAPDKGRRAFARHLRQLRQRSLKAGEPDHTTVDKPLFRSLSELIARQPYDRYEFDAHAKDVRFTLLLPNARGELISHRITKVWLLMIVEVHSTAVMAWRLVFGQAYTALDVAQCFAKALRPWNPRTLVAPGMVYAPGATMPQNLEAGCISAYVSAMDNAMAHHAHLPTEVWADHHDGILHLGPAHVPEIRATIESLFKRFEDGALRQLPGGVIPARELGAADEATSAFRGADHPIAVQALEDLMDVIVTGHNISPLPARQYRSPIDILVAYQSTENGWLPPPHADGDANALTTECRRRRLTGSRKRGKPVHLNLFGVVYRHPLLDQQWELLGQTFAILIDLEDLRTVRMVDDSLTELFILEAAPPWNVHAHDLTLRRRILKLSRSGELEIQGAHSAVSAYAAYTLASAETGRASAADQAAQLLQLMSHGVLDASPCPATSEEMTPSAPDIPRTGRVSFDYIRD